MIKKLVRWFKVRNLNSQLDECHYNMTFATDYTYSDFKRDTSAIINQLQELGYE